MRSRLAAAAFLPIGMVDTSAPRRARVVSRLALGSAVMGSLDIDWLRAQVESGASVTEMAAEAGCTPRTVRNVLHRNKIPLPREHRNEQVTAAVLADYRAGVKMAEIAAKHGVSKDWIATRVKTYGVTREVPVTPTVRRYKFPQLEDAGVAEGAA